MLGNTSQDSEPRYKLMYPTAADATAEQVNLLLATIHSLGMLQQKLALFDEDDNLLKPPAKWDGGVKCAVETSIMQACSRLDTIIEDPKRWTTTQNTRLENSLVRMHIANTRMVEEQQKFTANSNRPAFHLRPDLLHVEGQWLAVYGNALKNRVVGVGATPEKAMEDFDRQYRAKEPNPAAQIDLEAIFSRDNETENNTEGESQDG